jgi:phage/plasmid-like protein (TIGR03299 family)
MAHNINEGKRVFTVGESWHGLGTVVETEVTAKEAIKLAQLDFNVVKTDLFANDKKVESHVAITREDTKDILGITTPKYQIVQNIDAFGFFDTVVGDGQAIYHSAGALGLGERVWILAKLPNDIIINKDDTVEKFLCLTTSHDGKSSLQMYFTPIRVVCENTLNMSMSDAKNGIAIRHSAQYKNRIEEARKVLQISIDYYKQFEQIVKQFEEKTLTFDEVQGYFNNVLSIDNNREEISTQKENQKNDLLSLFDNGRGQKTGNKHSLWKAYNSVTEYVDYFRTVKNIDVDKTNRLKSIWFGSGAKMKEEAYNEALTLIK